MVRHGTAKKRRSGHKIKSKSLPKNKHVKIVNAIVNKEVRRLYDKKKTPAENLLSFGLVADVNNIKGSNGTEDSKYAAFIGYAEEMPVDKTVFTDANKRSKILSDYEKSYIKRNIDVHGNDFEAMWRDIKTNDMQYTAKKMETLCKKYHKLLEST